MKATFVTALQRVKVLSDLGRGDRLDDETFLTNNTDVIQGIVDSSYIKIIGTLEHNEICSADAIIYSTIETDQKNLIEALNRKLYETKLFLQSLWLHVDNAVDNELGFLLYNVNRAYGASSNFIAEKFTTAAGEYPTVELTRETLRSVRELYRSFSIASTRDDIATKLRKETTGRIGRVSRAFYLIQGARTSRDLAIKLLHYCSAAETIFSTSSAELSHTLAERVACFLSPRGEKRISCYKTFKRAYGLRSRATHGNTFAEKDMDGLRVHSIAVDDFLRRALRRLLTDHEIENKFESSEDIDDFFADELLGLGAVQPEKKSS